MRVWRNRLLEAMLAISLCIPEYVNANNKSSESSSISTSSIGTNESIISGSSVASMLLALAAVLGLIVALAWLMKKVPQRAYGAPTLLKVISSVAVGPRERVVIVEAGDAWLVLGVAPGQINALKELPKLAPNESPALSNAPRDVPTANRFASRLKRAMERRTDG